MDWAATPLGAVDTWSVSLQRAVEMCLNSHFPMAFGWGPELFTFYNDGYIPILGAKHPDAFGARGQFVFEEIWDWFLEPRASQVMNEGEAIWETDFQIPLIKNGVLQEGYFTFCYSPMADDDGEWQGVLSIATETTESVTGSRRDDMIHFLVRQLSGNRSIEAIPGVLLEALKRNPMDCEEHALVQFRPNGEISEVLFASSPEFSSRVLDCISVDASPVSRLDNHLYTINSFGKEVESEFSYSIVIGTNQIVSEDEALRRFLERIREALLVSIDRLRADERALSERDRLYRLLFENTLDGIFLTEPAGNIVAANPAACSLLGYTEEVLCEIGQEGLVFSDDQEVLSALETRRRKGQFSGELNFRKKDGSVLRCDLSSVRFHDDDGRERNLIIFRDASDRLEAEERNQRSARLEAVGQLTGGIAHDFNNLLQVMLGGADELKHLLREDDDARRYADMVFSASQRAADLTRQLLAFSRQQTLAPQYVDVSRQIREMDQILDRAIGEQVQVKIELGEETRAFLDPAQLQSVILNLAINAKDAMPGGGRLTLGSETVPVTAEVAEELECSPGNYVRLFVEDSGVGIPEKDLPRIIEPFYTTKAKGQGTGLGLSMVFGFVRQSDGGMRISSRRGEGTRVELFFPVRVGEIGHTEIIEEVALSRGEGEHILVVEDNELLATMLLRLLERAGYRTTLCVNGDEALTALRSKASIDLMITDVVLGEGIDGRSVAAMTADIRPRLPVIVMSGYMGEVDGGPGNPSQPLLRKPFRAREVTDLVARMLEHA